MGFGIRILLPVVLVRLLTKADIGEYNQFFLIETLIQTVFQLGVNQSQYYFVPRDPRNAGGIFLNCILLNLVLFSIGYTAVGLFRTDVAAWLGMPVLDRFFWYLTAYSILMLLGVATQVFLTARKEFLHAAVYDVGRQVVASIATLIAAFAFKSLEAVIAALVISRALTLAAGLVFVHVRHRGFASERYFDGVWRQVKYGVVLGTAGTVGTLTLRMHELAVSKFFPIETFAVYSQGLKQIPILLFFTQSVAEVALVRFAQLAKDDDWTGIRAFWDEVLGAMYAIGIPVTFLFVAVADPLVRLMYTDRYIEAVPIFQINAAAMLFHLVNPTLVLRALDRNDLTLRNNLAVLLLLPGALYLGMRFGGTTGIIAAHGLMLVCGRLVLQYQLNRSIPERLGIFPTWSAVRTFYAKTWNRGLGLVKR
ncbi:oligosaccharide flippase family protein [bacterium]|nr:oligosaccharide flippase family protein [bacterium]